MATPMTTNSWWVQNRGDGWAARRAARAQAFREEVMAEGGALERAGPRGPERAGQACPACGGMRHFAFRCGRKLCGRCCSAADGGACAWHVANGATA